MKESTKSSKKIFECSFMELYQDEVILDNQKTSERVYIKHYGAAAVLPIRKDGMLILINQYRYPIRQVNLEIPAGKKDTKDEDSLACVKRELEEETGYGSNDIEFYSRMFPCVGYSDEYIDLFIAKNCYPIANPKDGDEDEHIEIVYVTYEQAKELVASRKVQDAKTLILLQAYVLSQL